jgi:GNAT superfamily N-acetyltransferase
MGVEIAGLAPTSPPHGYRLIEIGSERGAEWAECLAAGYGLPLKVAEALSPIHVKSAEDVRFFAAEKDGRMDAVSLLAIHEGIAGVYSVGTREGARGQGLGTLVTAEPLRQAALLGVTKGVLQSSRMGYPVYRRLGFIDEGGVALYLAPAS